MDREDLQGVLEVAIDAARSAGAYTLGHFNTSVSVEMKPDHTPVTAADRGSEQRLRERIERAFPRHGILGEEFGEKQGSEPARWILDPIDGTYSFISGVPLYAVLVGFEWQGAALAGVIHLPALGETLWAASGLGCWWDGRRARVSEVAELGQARLMFGGAKGIHERGRTPAFERLRDACWFDRTWCDAYAYALLATGRAEIILDPVVNIWDTAAVMPIVTEAGGTFTDWSGNPTHTAGEAVATNRCLYSRVMAAIRG
jgi:histidinol-phosphatase